MLLLVFEQLGRLRFRKRGLGRLSGFEQIEGLCRMSLVLSLLHQPLFRLDELIVRQIGGVDA